MHRFLLFLLGTSIGLAKSAEEPIHYTLDSTAPLGLPEIVPAPENNPHRQPVFELGRRLFFDPVLSVDHTVSCAKCHDPNHGFASPEPLPGGVLGRRATRNAPTLFNRAFGAAQMWDGRFESLEEQVLQPIANELEMGFAIPDVIDRLRQHEQYGAAFREVFDTDVNEENLAQALAGFVRGLIKGNSPVDQFRAGDAKALTTKEKAGLWLFEGKGRCWRCHNGPNFSDESFHNTGIGFHDGSLEQGRFAVTGREQDLGAFKTPTLRGVGLTAPFMHDGSVASLREVLEFYRDGGRANSNLDEHVQAIDLSDADIENLVAFLESLSR